MEVIETGLLRGRVRLLQPAKGFRAASDTAFLAAGAVIKDKQSLLDVGCGVGGAGLCVLARLKGVTLTGIEIQQPLADLALQNAALNGMADQCRFFHGDLLTDRHAANLGFDAVIMNPPYQEAGTHTPSPYGTKAVSHGEGDATLEDWIRYGHKKLKHGKTLTLIHRADRLDDVILHLVKKRWFGSVEVIPLYPRKGEAAKRVIVRARKERYAPLKLHAGLILHTTSGAYTAAAKKVLEGGEPL